MSVFCGYGKHSEELSSIEVLDLKVTGAKWSLVKLKGTLLTPCFGLGAAVLSESEIALFGGYTEQAKADSDDPEPIGQKLTDVHIFDHKSRSLKKVAFKNKHGIVPVVYPSVSMLDRNLIVTADVYTHQVFEYDRLADQMRVIGRLPS